jgi:hypothetical protein
LNQKEKRQLNTELMIMGLAQLNDPVLIEQMANLVSDWPGDKHEYMVDLLITCEPGNRYEMYNAIAPRLRFKALSFPQYESQIALRAGEMVSQGRVKVEGQAPKPIEVGSRKLEIVPAEEATEVLASLSCHLCPAAGRFLGKTAVEAILKARRAGWVRDKALNKETCPDCAEVQAAEEIVTLSRKENLIITDHRRSS